MKCTKNFFSNAVIISLVFLLFLPGCRKSDSVLPIDSENYQNLKSKFFNTSNTRDEEVKRLAANIRRQDSLFNFLPDFAKKNGIPRWDKVHYKVNNPRTADNGNANFSSASPFPTGNTNEESQGLFLIPLQSVNSTDVKSYITAYKHNDSLYSYRLFNRDSLNTINAGSNYTKTSLLNTQAIFGFFENTINNADSIIVNEPGLGTIKNADVVFVENNPSNNNTPTNNCEVTITTTITYEWRDFTYGPGEWIPIAFNMSVVIFCDGSSGGGPDPTGGTFGNGNNNDPNNPNNWWNYGTGWPYDPNASNGTGSGGNNFLSDPNWYYWWSGFTGTNGTLPLNFDGFTIQEFNTTGVTDPCILSVLSTIGEGGYSTVLLSLYAEYFGTTNDKYKFIFQQDNNLIGNSGNPVIGHTDVNPMANGVSEVIIKINPSLLQNASKEYIATAILHELLHSFYKIRVPNSTEQQHHNVMFSSGAPRIAQSLVELFPNLTPTDAMSLALQGLDEIFLIPNSTGGTDLNTQKNAEMETKYGQGFYYANNKALEYKNGTLGTSC